MTTAGVADAYNYCVLRKRDSLQQFVSVHGLFAVVNTTDHNLKQELSYRKQIARQLRTQYAEGIYDNPVTLKSRLTVTQGHWKRNY